LPSPAGAEEWRSLPADDFLPYLIVERAISPITVEAYRSHLENADRVLPRAQIGSRTVSSAITIAAGCNRRAKTRENRVI
jgi:site-specific recombinase XerD